MEKGCIKLKENIRMIESDDKLNEGEKIEANKSINRNNENVQTDFFLNVE